MSHHEFQLCSWHLHTGVFVAFWVLSAYFDSFFVTAGLCAVGGFATDYLQKLFPQPKVNTATINPPTKPLPSEPIGSEDNKGNIEDGETDSEIDEEMDVKMTNKSLVDPDEGDPWTQNEKSEPETGDLLGL